MSLPLSTDVHNRLVNFIRYLETQSFIEPSNDRIVNTLKNLLHDITGVWYSNNDISLRTVETLLKGALWVVDHLPTASPCPPCPECEEFSLVSAQLFRINQTGGIDGSLAESLTFPYMTSVKEFQIVAATDLVTLEMPVLVGNPTGALTGAGRGYLNIEDCSALTTANPGQADIRQFTSFYFQDNAALTDFDGSLLVWGPIASPMTAPDLRVTGAALTEDIVNGILIRAASFLPLANNTISIDLSGGTSAAPTGAGAAAAAALVAAGNSITTN